jgi:MoaA/NifB/PqqE/SkfB family radical SAM enzyme
MQTLVPLTARPSPAAAAERSRQFEIQLGHLCNNRCVFCVSGQLTHEREAPLLDGEVLKGRLTEAHALGHRRVTLLGGEPTIQPFFMDLVRHAVGLGFEEIVIFSNGSRTGRTELMDEVLATGGRFEWRFSFQGATEAAHERTTRRKGSFGQLVRSLELAQARRQKSTVNMCVVSQNADSLDQFPALLLPRGVRQLHVDMLHPDDTGSATEAEVAAMLPRYTALVPQLERMVHGFPAGFDVNIGNLPYCVAPALAPWIRHGGEPTTTVSADGFGAPELNDGRNKYAFKQRNKVKPETCASCVFDARCSGVFADYARVYGLGELVPVTPERLVTIDPQRKLFAAHLTPRLRAALSSLVPPAPFVHAALSAPSLEELTITLEAEAPAIERLTVAVRAPGGGSAATEEFSLHVAGRVGDETACFAGFRALFAALSMGGAVVHPPGVDAFEALAPALGTALARLRSGAPFGELAWTDVTVLDGGTRVELTLTSAHAERALVWLAARDGRSTGGYRVEAGAGGPPSSALVGGLRSVMQILGRIPPG